ncbi:GAF domain-containing protein [Trichocoleus sp. FACHB-591]|uniref:GAF domain-containing protein n=1 Tax=Trichocoleus sp. FACHB-591 TaxID=2692872 RepID=UPI0016838DA6|nr:GAF domain-containing protein [Trichocoleus sp. FACHB-591]MBD2096536.1 GAF domain-containing protein [Trichocoleus sp. FACHB-591]
MDIPPNQIPKGNILIVDDTPENLHLLSSTLTERGYQVRGVIDGVMALRVVRSAPPDLILLDIQMPRINGYEVCQQLKAAEQTREIPVIFLSVLDETWDKVKAFEVGGADYITKPFQAEEVLARIENQLALQAAKTEIRNLNAELEQRVQQRTEELAAANQELRIEITQRQQAEATLRQQAEQKELLAEITQRIRQSLNLDAILNTTVVEVRQLLRVERVLIYRFEPDWSGVVIVESVITPNLSILGRTVKDQCFSDGYARQYRQGRVLNIADIYAANLSPCHVDLLAALQIRANLVVPIVQEQTLWGLLSVNQCTQPRPWSPLEIDLLKQLSDQAAIALQQSHLYQQVQQLNANLEQQVQARTAQLQQARDFDALLKRITDKVRDNLDERQILQTAVRELALGLAVASCDTALYDLGQQTATTCYEYTTLNRQKQGKTVSMAEFPEIYHHLLHRQWFQSCEAYLEHGALTLLACPIFDDQGVLGDLWLSRLQATVFVEHEIRLVQQVANQCAIAIRQARLYAAAQSQVAALESLHQMKDDFLSTVSHELRTPVTNMKMAIKMLKVTLARSETAATDEPAITGISQSANATPNSRVTQYLRILDSECEREISLINDLLDLQRLEFTSAPLVTERIDLKLWLSALLESFQERADAHQQYLQIEIPDSPPQIESNPDALNRILVELLHNACKYTPPEERIVVSVAVEQNQLQLRVTNFGAEIPASDLPQIFDKFYRVAHADRWKQGGTGLGLALVQKLVKHLGGAIDVNSAQGETTFAVSLPIVV